MSKEQQPEWVALNGLLIEERFQIRSRMNGEAVSRYLSAYRNEQKLPPVKVARVQEKGSSRPPVLILVDGFHRIEALKRLGRKEAEAYVMDATAKEARWLAAQANLTHGLPLKSKEIRKAFRVYVNARQHRDGSGFVKSYRQIAEDLGGCRSHVTIRSWMRKDFPKIAASMSDKEFPPEGPGNSKRDEVTLQQIASEHILQARNAAQGVKSPEERWELAQQLRAIADELEGEGVSVPDF